MSKRVSASDRLYLLGTLHVRAEVLEETRSASEENGDERDEQLIHEPSRQILLDGGCTTAEGHVHLLRSGARLFEC